MSEVLSEAGIQELRASLNRYGQGHVLQFWDDLSIVEQLQLVADLETIDLEEMQEMWDRTQNEAGLPGLEDMVPIEEELCESYSTCDPQTLQAYQEEALRAMSEGQVGVLLLAGGQGTRLGVPYPKGMYDIGLASGKTLYQIQVERILRLQELAKRLTGRDGQIRMYVMTSESTKQPTLDFFQMHGYFGASEEQISIFEQRTIPAFDHKGRFLLEKKNKVARSPDGNGGLYWALKNEGILEDLEKRDVRYLHAFCVDNVLVKVADPHFMGYCIAKKAEAGNKVVEKGWPTEAVGVVVKINNRIQVVEYSEISQEQAEQRDTSGRLTFRAGNICNHFFTTEFLKRVCLKHERELPHHVAHKKVGFVSLETGATVAPPAPNAIKLEKFVFDVFQFSHSFVVWECIREEEFSPLKNADGAEKDTPTTARQSLHTLHRQYLERAGARLKGDPDDGVEVSPLVSYAGEGLELLAGKTLTTPLEIHQLADIQNGGSANNDDIQNGGPANDDIQNGGLANGDIQNGAT